MSTEDAPPEVPPAAGNVDDPASVGQPATGLPIPIESGAPIQPCWTRPAIAFVVALAHASALIALSSVSRPAPPAEETIEVNVIAAGDEVPVTTSAAQALTAR